MMQQTRVNLQNIQTAHTTQQQKNKQQQRKNNKKPPIKKQAGDHNRHFSKENI